MSFQLFENTSWPSLLAHLHISSRRVFLKNKQKQSPSELLVLKAYLVGSGFSLIIFLWLVLEVRWSIGSAAEISILLFDLKSAIVVLYCFCHLHL